MKLDPEEQIFSAALEQAELDQANERGAYGRLEFTPEGYAKVTLTISHELVERAKVLNMTTWELFLEAIRLVAPDEFPSAAFTGALATA